MLKKYQQTTNSVVRFVNSFTVVNQKTLDAFAPRKMRTTLFELANYCAKTGLVVGPLGQISRRLSGGKMLITASGVSFSRIRDEDLIVAPYTGEWTTAAEDADQNLNWHKAIYKNEEAQAVLFCQPAAALAKSMNPAELNPDWMVDAPGVVGKIGFTGESQTDPISLSASHQVILIKGKGILSWGSNLEEAIDRAEVTERWCQVALNMSQRK